MPPTKRGWTAETRPPRPAARQLRYLGGGEVVVVRRVEPRREARRYEAAKRLVDVLSAAVLLVVLLPLFVLFAVAIKLESPGRSSFARSAADATAAASSW